MPKRQDLYLISMAADLLDMHPQTLRKYERLGLVQPHRTLGSMRVYTQEELDRIRMIKTLVDEDGINLAGVQRLLSILDVVRRIRPLVRTRMHGSQDIDVLRHLDKELAALLRLFRLDDPDD